MLVWEKPYYPTYYIPLDDIDTTLLSPSGETRHSPSRGAATLFTVKVPGREAADAAARYEDSPITELRDLVRFDWEAMDAWYEEDELVYAHPRDPHTRVDILASSRHVRVELAGVTVADSPRPRLLFETGLPTRYYLPRTDARMDLLEHSETVTRCPYKGQTEHFAARIDGQLKDVAWSYPTPLPESQKIAGLIAFYDERVDTFIDGARQDRPKTPFSWRPARAREHHRSVMVAVNPPSWWTRTQATSRSAATPPSAPMTTAAAPGPTTSPRRCDGPPQTSPTAGSSCRSRTRTSGSSPCSGSWTRHRRHHRPPPR
jgi:uncharacterized protein (DUF427 family)